MMTTQLKWNLCVREQEVDTKVKYIPFRTEEKRVDFFLHTIDEEVKRLSKERKKKIKRVCQTTLAACVSFFVLVGPALASPIAVPVTAPTVDPIMPSDIWKLGMYLIGLCIAIQTVLAIILMQLAGGYRMLKKDNSNDATKWTQEIMKGYTQALLAPIIIVTLAFLAYVCFGSSEWFVKPF